LGNRILDLSDEMRLAAIAAYPREACGLVVKCDDKKAKLAVCQNISTTPENHFIIDIAEYDDVAQTGEVIAIWHSHVETDNRPSPADLVGCEATDLPWAITSSFMENGAVSSSDPHIFYPSGFEIDYIGRPYVLGALDCYSLLVDYYKREYGICLRNHQRVSKDGNVDYEKFLTEADAEGFALVNDGSAMPGDVFLIQMGSDKPNHVAIYVGQGMMLHHLMGRLSRRDVYGGYWEKHTSHTYRHKQKC